MSTAELAADNFGPGWTLSGPGYGMDSTVGYDRLGRMGIVAMVVHATAAPDFSAACSGGSAGSQWTPRNRRPDTFAAASETSHTRGGTITSGWIIVARSKPASSEIIGVLVIPPGTKTLTVTPLPLRSFAMIALRRSDPSPRASSRARRRLRAPTALSCAPRQSGATDQA